MAYQVCRLCLGKGINLIALNTGENSLGQKLSACMPEINIFIINNPLICTGCINELDMAYKFRVKCLLTEKQINMCVRNLYLKSIGCPRKVTEAPTSQHEDCTSPGSLNTYLDMSILEGLAEARNGNEEEVAVAKKKTEAPKDKQIQPCFVELIDCFEGNCINVNDKRLTYIYDEKEHNTLNESKIKGLQINKYGVEQNILNCTDNNNMLNCTTSKVSYQKRRKKLNANDKQMYLKSLRDKKTRQIKLISIAELKRTNEMPRYIENKLNDESDTCNVPIIDTEKNDSNKTQFQNGRNPTNTNNSCTGEPENICKKESTEINAETFNKDIPIKRGRPKGKVTKKKVLNNEYAKVYKNRKPKLPDSVFELKIRSVPYVQNQRETFSEKEQSKDDSCFGNETVNKNKTLQKSATAKVENVEHKMVIGASPTPVNCRKAQVYVNNLCHMCNIVINNVEIWKKHIRDHILTY